MAKQWIAGAIKHPGALHRDLGVPQGQSIPRTKLAAAAKRGGVVGRRARLAETLAGFSHGGGPAPERPAGRQSNAALRKKMGR